VIFAKLVKKFLYIIGPLSYVTELPTYPHLKIQGGSNMTGTDLYVNKPHCAAAVRP